MLVIDGVNSLTKGSSLSWMPPLPASVTIFASAVNNDAHLSALASQLQQKIHPQHHNLMPVVLKPLGEEDSQAIVEKYLDSRQKHVDKEQLAAMSSKADFSLPLYASVLCKELALYGIFEKVLDRINELPGTLPELYETILGRLVEQRGEKLIEAACALLLCSKAGLDPRDFRKLLIPYGTGEALWWGPQLLYELEPLLAPCNSSGGVLRFAHAQVSSGC